jgi:hypothetical protein
VADVEGVAEVADAIEQRGERLASAEGAERSRRRGPMEGRHRLEGEDIGGELEAELRLGWLAH